jgi:mannobiose 2-epimerase
MLDPQSGAGFMQFALDFTPLRAIRFDVEWGSDEEPEGGSMPLDITSYGHNIEFAWLLLHAADILGQPRDTYKDVVRKICDQAITFGIDQEFGGIYIDGPMAAPTKNLKKQFWQQAESIVGLLDAYAMLGDEKYWAAFKNIHDFIFTKFINRPAGGEWYALLDRDGTPIWDYLGHEWKISYHTVRSMVQTVRRLKQLA